MESHTWSAVNVVADIVVKENNFLALKKIY